MGFFNEIGKKTTETTTKIARETRLKIKINENKSKIKELYEAIGRKAYESHVREENINVKELIGEELSKIDGLSKEIEDARQEILVLNNKKMCSKCFAEIETESKFCPKCGEKQGEDKTVFEEAEEKLEEVEIFPENEKKAEIVKEELEEKNNNE